MSSRLRKLEVLAPTIVIRGGKPRRARTFDIPDPTVTRTIVELMAPTMIWTRSDPPAPPLALAAAALPQDPPLARGSDRTLVQALPPQPAPVLAEGSAPASLGLTPPIEREVFQLARRIAMQADLPARREQELRDTRSPFWPEVVAERCGAASAPGRLVTPARRWIRWAYPAQIGLVIALVIAAALIEVPMYSTGVSIITIEGEQVTSPLTGTVAEVLVTPGVHVAIGDPVLRLRALDEQAELAATETDYRNALATFLTTPGDDGARTALAAIATRRQRAKAVVDARTLRASVAGSVGDIRVRPGQLVTPGAQVMKISPSAALSVVALLPGLDRPRLEVGMTLQIELPGYHKAREAAVIDAIGSQVIGPEEARRALGDPIGDALPITGPVVIVRAHLTARTFEAGGREYAFHDGMLGKAEVRVDHQTLVRALLPGNGR